jgi:hypothetical protein
VVWVLYICPPNFYIDFYIYWAEFDIEILFRKSEDCHRDGAFTAETCAHFGGCLFAARRLMGSARDDTGLYRILITQGRRSVSNFYADLAILAARRGAGAYGNPARPCIGTHAQLPVLERERARASRRGR